MSTITLKNIPDALHDFLRSLAIQNRRSLNSEIIKRLEDSVHGTGLNIQDILPQARNWRKKLSFQTTSKQIDSFKRQGRP